MLASIAVGAWTAWHLGLRAGAIAFAVSLAALIAAGVIPGLSLAVYAIIAAWCAALYFLGPRLGAARAAGGASRAAGGAEGAALARAKRWALELLSRR
jgi:hypothetical protein